MHAVVQQSQRAPDGAPLHCERHCPEQTTLYRLVQQHAASFIARTNCMRLQTVTTRLMKLLTRRGVLIEEMGQTCLAEPDAEGDEAHTLRPLQAAAITYRIAFGPRAEQKVLTLRGAIPREASARQPLCADIDGFGPARGSAGRSKRLQAAEAAVLPHHSAGAI